MWEGEDGDLPDKNATPKQRLMNWIKSKIPEMPITNFTTDWNDGRAVGALVDAVAPGLCPDWQDWNPNDAAQNASEAMGLADDWLNIPQVRLIVSFFLSRWYVFAGEDVGYKEILDKRLWFAVRRSFDEFG